jgi:hypothetical protein
VKRAKGAEIIIEKPSNPSIIKRVIDGMTETGQETVTCPDVGLFFF